jgi:hypothetical protein
MWQVHGRQRQQGAGGRRSGCRGGYGLRELAQQDQEECVVLTEAGIGWRRGGGRSSTTAGGEDNRCSWTGCSRGGRDPWLA